MSRFMSDQQVAEIEWSLLEQPELGIVAEVPRVLLIDAEDDALLVLTALLVPENQVCVASNRAAALAMLQRDSYALVVLDPAVDLPAADTTDTADTADSPDMLTLVRQYHGVAPLLLYSASKPDTQPGERGLAYLAKPWSTPRQLWDVISKLLGSGAVVRAATGAGRENSALV